MVSPASPGRLPAARRPLFGARQMIRGRHQTDRTRASIACATTGLPDCYIICLQIREIGPMSGGRECKFTSLGGSGVRKTLIRAALLAAGSATLIATVAPLASGAGRTSHQAAPKSVRISAHTVKGLGTILVSSTGRTLYVFAPDNHKKVTCGPKLGCDVVWPPEYISASGKPVAGSGGVQQSLLGSDPDRYAPGKHVVTYKGWPLYVYAGDHKSGTATGQDTKGSGGLWYVITTDRYGDQAQADRRHYDDADDHDAEYHDHYSKSGLRHRPGWRRRPERGRRRRRRRLPLTEGPAASRWQSSQEARDHAAGRRP